MSPDITDCKAKIVSFLESQKDHGDFIDDVYIASAISRDHWMSLSLRGK